MLRRCIEHGQRGRDGRVAAEARFVRRAVERDERCVDRTLVDRVAADQRSRRSTPFTLATARSTPKPPNADPAVAQIDRLEAPARRAGGRDAASATSRRRAGRRLQRSAAHANPRCGAPSSAAMSDFMHARSCAQRARKVASSRHGRGNVAKRKPAHAYRARQRASDIPPATCRRRGQASDRRADAPSVRSTASLGSQSTWLK